MDNPLQGPRLFFKGGSMVTFPEGFPAQKLNDVALIWDPDSESWAISYRTDFKRLKAITLIDNITFDANTTTHTGKVFDIKPYRDCYILINVAVTSAPTDILIDIEVSDDYTTFYKYMQGPFGDLRYEDAAGDKKEALPFPLRVPYMRVKATATGTSGTNKFTLTVKAAMIG